MPGRSSGPSSPASPTPTRRSSSSARTIVIVANLQPAKLMGIESNGMVLAASTEGGKPTARQRRREHAGRRTRPMIDGARPMIDSHCHLAGPEFAADLAGRSWLGRARPA